MSIELGEIFFRKSDSKIFSVRKIDNRFNPVLYILQSNDKEQLILNQKEIQKKFN